jgi:hypothetical protein
MYNIHTNDEVAKLYNEVIDKASNLYIKIGIDKDILAIYLFYLTMMEKGYFSENLCVTSIIPDDYIKLEDRSRLPLDLCGSYIMNGYSQCRHTTDFLSHIYRNLGFDSSQLFVYRPKIKYNVITKHYISSDEINYYMSEAIKDFNVYSREEHHFIKEIDIAKVQIDFEPQLTKTFPNHTLNIVRDTNTNESLILDSHAKRIGDKSEETAIRLYNYDGWYYVDYVFNDFCDFFTKVSYYGTDYSRGVKILKHNDFHVQTNLEKLKLLKNEVEKYNSLLKSFWKDNKKLYSKTSDEIKKLIK